MRHFIQDSCFGADRSPRDYAPVSPENLARTQIPLPKYNHLSVQHPKVPSPPGKFLTLPHPRDDPGLYGCAVDLMKHCNELFGSCESGAPTNEEVERAVAAFVKEHPNEPLPPDHRLLCIPDPFTPENNEVKKQDGDKEDVKDNEHHKNEEHSNHEEQVDGEDTVQVDEHGKDEKPRKDNEHHKNDEQVEIEQKGKAKTEEAIKDDDICKGEEQGKDRYQDEAEQPAGGKDEEHGEHEAQAKTTISSLYTTAIVYIRTWTEDFKTSALLYPPTFQATIALESKIFGYTTRYLVYHAHSKARLTTPDYQPSPSTVDKYISQHPTGLTLAQIHQHFPNTTNIRLLIHRILRFTTYSRTTDTFDRKWMPSEEDVIEKLDLHRPKHWHDLVSTFPGGVGSEDAILSLATQLAEYDRTTGRMIPEGKNFPERREVFDVLALHREKGVSRVEMMAAFPNRVCSERRFRDVLLKVGYPKVEDPARKEKCEIRYLPDPGEEDVFFPRHEDGFGGWVSMEETKVLEERVAELRRRLGVMPQKFFEVFDRVVGFEEGRWVVKGGEVEGEKKGKRKREVEGGEVEEERSVKKTRKLGRSNSF